MSRWIVIWSLLVPELTLKLKALSLTAQQVDHISKHNQRRVTHNRILVYLSPDMWKSDNDMGHLGYHDRREG